MDLFGEEPEAPKKLEKSETIDMTTEAPPAADNGPRSVKLCYGHGDIESTLISMLMSQRPPQALIFAGPQGVGKSTMAFQIARLLLAKGSSQPENIVARRIASGAHPDLLTIERALDPVKDKRKDNVDIAEVRKVTPFLRRTASDGSWRVVIVDDADTMNRAAQNALLKILEEPPGKTLLILIAHRAGALIPTIRSRCRLIPFQSLDDAVMTRLLHESGHALSPRDIDMLIALSGGSYGRALGYIEENALEVLDKILNLLESYPAWDWPKIHAMADELARPGQEQAFQTSRALLCHIWTQIVLTKAKGRNAAAAPLDRDVFAELLQNSSLETLSKICENLKEHFDSVQRANLDVRQGVLGAFSLMRQAA